MAEARGGTRISCKIQLILSTLDNDPPLSGPCLVVLVNIRGCAARFNHPLKVGSAVRLEGLPMKPSVTARVVNCIQLGEYEKFWFLGLMLDEPGNVWGIASPPEDWGITSSAPA